MSMSTCPNCTAEIPSGFRFCGNCGASLVEGAGPAGPGVFRRYRGPLVLGSIGTVLLVGGGGVATAILSAFQLDAAPAILVDVFQPFIEEQVGGTIADGVADVTGTADGATEVSAWMLAGFVVSALVAAFGGLLMIIAGAWGANRAMGKRRAGTVAIPPAPVPQAYARPVFAPPAAPTVAVPRPPGPAAPPTVAVPPAVAPVPPAVAVPPGPAPAESPTVALPQAPAPAEAPTVVIPSSDAPTAVVPHQPPPPSGRRLG